jgi:membrane protease YdiL (CAAX protease family)
MHRLFNIIAQVSSEARPAASVMPLSYLVSILPVVGLCILGVWLLRFGGFRALQKAPVRRHRRWVIFCPVAILFLWLVCMTGLQMLTGAIFHLLPKTTLEAISYPVNAALEISFIAGMLILARKSFARGLKGFGLRPSLLIQDTPMAIVHLLAVLPLILAGLWCILTIGRLYKGPEFNLEVHQSLDLLTNAGIATQLLIAGFAVLIVPVFEELLFRGFLQSSLRSLSGKPWIAIVLTSLFFAILHPPTHIPALFFLSCGLGYAYERSGSLFRPILMHVFFNGFSVAVTVLQSS